MAYSMVYPTSPTSPMTTASPGNYALKRVAPVTTLTYPVQSPIPASSTPPPPAQGLAGTVAEYKKKASAKASELKEKVATIVKDPQFKTLTITTGTGTVVVGTIGGAFGLASGMVAGSVAGVPPALFTFGLSIPAGAVVGGGAGSALGASAGAGVGALSGYGVFKYRVEIKDGLVYVKVKATDKLEYGSLKVVEAVDGAKLKICGAAGKAKAKAGELKTYAMAKTSEAAGIAKGKAGEVATLATTTKAGVTCTSAAAGAIVGSTGGGGMGLLGGAAVGVVPALFTFGLSIPFGAACGLCVGASVGGATGATAGAAAGYGGFTYRKEISSKAQKTWDTARSSAETVKVKAMESATQVTESVKSLVGGSTGGTA